MRRHAIALSVLAAALLLGGCGQDNDNDPTSEGSDGARNTSAGSPTDQPTSEHERALRYAECLRDNGLDVEDPTAEQPRPRVDPNADPEKLREARKACRDYAPQSVQERTNNPEMRSAMLKLAECLRERGIEVEDPGPNGLIDFDAETRNDPRFAEAMEACGQRMGDQLGGQSGESGSGDGAGSGASGSADGAGR